MEILNCFLRLQTSEGYLFSPLIFNIVLEIRKGRKERRKKDFKGKNKTVLFPDDVIVKVE